jgi:hypothetical protein
MGGSILAVGVGRVISLTIITAFFPAPSISERRLLLIGAKRALFISFFSSGTAGILFGCMILTLYFELISIETFVFPYGKLYNMKAFK